MNTLCVMLLFGGWRRGRDLIEFQQQLRKTHFHSTAKRFLCEVKVRKSPDFPSRNVKSFSFHSSAWSVQKAFYPSLVFENDFYFSVSLSMLTWLYDSRYCCEFMMILALGLGGIIGR